MATTRQYTEGPSCKLRELASKIADALVATGKWDKIVDNTPVGGTAPSMSHYVIVSPKQTYRYATASAAATDNGVGATPRYTHNTGYGAERLYVKFNPVFNASAQLRGFSVQMANALNDAGTDLRGTTAQQNAGTILDYKQPNGTVTISAPFGTTSTYYARCAISPRLESPTNTNITHYPQILPYNTFVSPESDARFWIVSGTDDTPTLANTKDKEDWATIVVQGLTGANLVIDIMTVGLFKSPVAIANQFGVSRAAIFASYYDNNSIPNFAVQLLSFPTCTGAAPTNTTTDTLQDDVYPATSATRRRNMFGSYGAAIVPSQQ